MIEYSKLQIGCLLIVLYMVYIYAREKLTYKIKKRERGFERLVAAGIFGIVLDGATAYTVNHLHEIPKYVNDVLHLLFLCSMDCIVFCMFLYIKEITGNQSKKVRIQRLPLLINLAVVVLFLPELTYHSGEMTNYSMGISAYTCYVMVMIYMIATIFLLIRNKNHLDSHKEITILTCLVVSIVVTVYQMLHPQALISCLVPTFTIIATYLNLENPLFLKLQNHNREMVMGFSALIENRDGNTGGHIRRTTEYVKILAEELIARGYYEDVLTEDYKKNLLLAAPMHDIGKIAIPDAILQKPGKLTDEEYEKMKTHAACGGEIVRETFGTSSDEAYGTMAYEVARHHHEKWNGRGYPDQLLGDAIPLCARIMAVADVFDAVSANRCYRRALPLDTCFRIIKEGRGTDFEPLLVDVFLDKEEEIRQICEDRGE